LNKFIDDKFNVNYFFNTKQILIMKILDIVFIT